MCGICGFVGSGADPVDLQVARAMRDVMRHRGPDGFGEALVDSRRGHGRLQGWFGHRRLKILDLTAAAHQPMSNEDGSVVLSYNGEIYNFRELRRELQSAGFRFRSTGDTEVVLRAYERWGADFVMHLDGMFAVAIWDERAERLVLARDRTGKKPLFYTVSEGRLTFASEIKGLLAAPWVRREPDLSRVAEFLTFGYVPHPNTMLKGIVQVPPASLVIFDADGVRRPRTYWDAAPAPEQERPYDAALVAEVANRLDHAVRRRMVSDVPLGALLSGGLDSSLVVGLMARHSPEPIHTFTIGFPEEPRIDETAHARVVSEHFNTVHTEFSVQADAVALLDALLWFHDQPFGDSSAIPTFIVCQLARERVAVVLNGDGGDEVFGGYTRFSAVSASGLVPPALGRAGRSLTRALPGRTGQPGTLRRRVDRYFELAGMPVRDRYQSWIAVLNENLLSEVLRPAFCRQIEAGALTASMERQYERVVGLPTLDQILYANFKTYLPDDLAVKMDRMSMASSLETRSPFLDTALIECVAAVRAKHKVGLRHVKPLLRKTFWPMLPRSIWNRRKQGFGVPNGRWFRGELGTIFADEVLAPDSRTGEFLRRDMMRKLWDEHQRGERDHGIRFWSVLMLERWLRECALPQSLQPPATPGFEVGAARQHTASGHLGGAAAPRSTVAAPGSRSPAE